MRLALSLSIALIVGCASADAADYPSKPIRVVIPYAAGSTGEAAFRIIERHAFEKEEPDPSRVQHQREHGAAAFRRGDANWQGLPALENK